MATEDRYHIRSVERALTILRLFLACDEDLSGSDISRRIDLPQSTTFRLLQTLAAGGFVEQARGLNRYRLGVTCLELGNAFLKRSDLRQRALGLLQALRDETGETVHLAVFADREVVYLEKLAGLHAIGLMGSRVGGRSPAYCTGLGKALLAYLPEEEIRRHLGSGPLTRYTPTTITDIDLLLEELAAIRARGYAVDNQEHEPGVVCVAAPIFDSGGIAAAVSVSGPVDRMGAEGAGALLAEWTLRTAAAISVQGGGRFEAQRKQALKSRDV